MKIENDVESLMAEGQSANRKETAFKDTLMRHSTSESPSIAGEYNTGSEGHTGMTPYTGEPVTHDVDDFRPNPLTPYTGEPITHDVDDFGPNQLTPYTGEPIALNFDFYDGF